MAEVEGDVSIYGVGGVEWSRQDGLAEEKVG